MTRVGLIEDNLDFRAEVAFHLRRNGFAIALESDGSGIDAQLADRPCDLLVLDLGLPVEDGLVIARRLRRQQPWLGIVMLTARGSLDDRLAGFEEGADAYLIKPIDMRELVATLHSVQRRLAVPALTTESWSLTPDTLSIGSPAGVAIALTATEMDLLKCLAAAAPEPVSREALAAAMGHTEPDFDYRRLEVAFSRLRKKIETATAGESPIRAARGRGYVFAAPMRVVAQ
ncbi:MAG: response regulator transcription factor [Rhodocyclaceae bacterium]|nr:response regulator transcription factor [Rhodocyclaceae bacterium]MDZ4216527.1 response regulator transcription factor [Rhodocyclaceae bacterium]